MRYLLAITLALFTCAGAAAAADVPAGAGVISSGSWGALWVCGPTYKTMQNTAVPAKKTGVVRISAARNEFEPFQIVLRPKKALANVNVVPHTMTGPNSATIPAWNISTKLVEYVNVTEPTSSDVSAGMYPDPLPDFAPFTALAEKNNPVWITVYVPASAKPGVYKGTVDVSADGIKKIVVPVELKVWDFELPSVSKLRTAFGNEMSYAADYQGATTLEQKRKLLDLYNRDFWRHRVAPYSPYAYYDIKTSIKDGYPVLDFSDFDIALEKYFPMFNSFMLPKPDFAEDEQQKIGYMRALSEHLADKGQLHKAYDYIFDEPTEDQYGNVNEMANIRRMADQRIKVLLTEQPEPKLSDAVDIWVPIINNYDEKTAKERQAKGNEVWWYICCGPRHPYPNNFIDYPALDQRILPWISWRYGVNGILYWETCYWKDNPWESPMSYTPDKSGKWGNGDGHLLYPPVKQKSAAFVDKGPVDSIRWEMIREGIEDYDYFYILKSKMDAASKDANMQAAIAKAKEALKMVNECGKSPTEYTREPSQLEAARAKVAEAIEALD